MPNKRLEMFDLKDYLLSLKNVSLKKTFGKHQDVYFVKLDLAEDEQTEDIFAVVDYQYKIDQIMLKSEPDLAEVLRGKYESVSAATNLNPKIWSTFILSGQLTDEELIDLIDHSYRLTKQGFKGQ